MARPLSGQGASTGALAVTALIEHIARIVGHVIGHAVALLVALFADEQEAEDGARFIANLLDEMEL